MENRTQFSLEKEIKQWRSEFSNSSSFSDDNVEELETHLLDEISALNEKGLTYEEAFWIAKNRIGSTSVLQQEYKKVNKSLDLYNKIIPYVKGTLIFSVIFSIFEIVHILLLNATFSIGILNLNTVSIGVLLLFGVLILLVFYLLYQQKLKIFRFMMKLPFLLLLNATFYLLHRYFNVNTLLMNERMELIWGSTINTNFYQFAALFLLLFYLLILTLSFQKASWVNKKPKTN